MWISARLSAARSARVIIRRVTWGFRWCIPNERLSDTGELLLDGMFKRSTGKGMPEYRSGQRIYVLFCLVPDAQGKWWGRHTGAATYGLWSAVHFAETFWQLQDRHTKKVSKYYRSYIGNFIFFVLFSYWDPIYDLQLMQNSIALNMLYILTLSDCDRGWIICNSTVKEELATLKANGNKKEVSCTRICSFNQLLNFECMFSTRKWPENCLHTAALSSQTLSSTIRTNGNELSL